MNTVNPLKRPLTESSDSLKLLVCKICEKGDIVLNMKTCGCLFCDSCDCVRDVCISCQSKVDPKIKLSFTKNVRCKYYGYNQCYSSAEYKCKCVPNCFVCGSCLAYIHSKKVRESCVPDILRHKVTQVTITKHEPCQLCGVFIAEFRMTSEPFKKVCFDCKIIIDENVKEEKIVDEKQDERVNKFDPLLLFEPDWNRFDNEYEQSAQIMSDKIKKIEETLESSCLARELARGSINECEEAISGILQSLRQYAKKCDEHIAFLKQQLDNSKKDKDYLRPDGIIKTILDLLRNEQLTLHGENGNEQIFNLLNYYREKSNYNPHHLIAEQIKTFVAQSDSMRQHFLQFSMLSLPITGVSTEPSTSFQEIIDNGVKPFVISVERCKATKNERKKILEDIHKHEDKWVHKDNFQRNDIVIIFDADAIGSPKYKRARVLKRGKKSSKVLLLDFGFQIKVKNSSIGKINEISVNGKSTRFLAQLTGSVDVNCKFIQKDGFPNAEHIRVIN